MDSDGWLFLCVAFVLMLGLLAVAYSSVPKLNVNNFGVDICSHQGLKYEGYEISKEASIDFFCSEIKQVEDGYLFLVTK